MEYQIAGAGIAWVAVMALAHQGNHPEAHCASDRFLSRLSASRAESFPHL